MITDEMFKKGKFWTDGPMVVTGCTKVSKGCERCWAEKAHVMRQGRSAWPSDCLTDGRFNGMVHFRLEALEKAVKGKKPKVIAIWNDMYHEGVTDEQIFKVYEQIFDNFDHTYLIITKRIKRANEFVTDFLYENELSCLPDNIWHIATMENQDMVDERMEHLAGIPGRRAVIIEPMLGPVNFRWMKPTSRTESTGDLDILKDIHQVILGPENGKGKRPFNEEWAESVRLQCERAGVPFYRKDKGEGELAWR